jgi:hypothetical protein
VSKYRRWFRLGRRLRDVERELDEELDAHIALLAEQLERRGVAPGEAVTQARARFADRHELYASARDREERLNRVERFEDIWRDLGFAWRRAVRSPGPTILALVTFALGIGLTTAGFAVVDRVLIRPLTLPASDRVVALLGQDSAGRSVSRISAATWRVWHENAQLFDGMALHQSSEVTVSGDDDGAFRVPALRASSARRT